jgi:hypothetical protein
VATAWSEIVGPPSLPSPTEIEAIRNAVKDLPH